MKVNMNTFFLVAFLCASAAAVTAAGGVQIFPNFLSSDEVEHYRQEASARNKNNKDSKAAASSAAAVHQRQLTVATTSSSAVIVTLKEHVHDMVRTALLAADKKDEGTWVKKLMLDSQAPVTTWTNTFKSHVVYYYQDGDVIGDHDEPVKKDHVVGFIFLTQEEDAYFRHGADKVQSQTGTLVTYHVDEDAMMMKHETVIPQGKTLEILGPFALDADSQCLRAVGPGKKKTFTRKLMMQNKLAGQGKELDTVPIALVALSTAFGSSGAATGRRLGQKTSKTRKLKSGKDKGGKDKGGKDGGGASETTVVATETAPAPPPDLNPSTDCGCKATNGVVQCITTGCATVATSTTATTTTDTTVASPTTPVDTTTTGTTTTTTDTTVASPPPPDDVFASTPSETVVAGPTAPAAALVPLTMAPAVTPVPPADATLEFTPPLAPEPGMTMTWEMQGGEGPCTCTQTSTSGGYCVGECGLNV